MSSNAAVETEFAPAVARGLLEYGPFDTELCLELGLSIWLHQSATSPEEARSAMLELRAAILDVSGLDPRSEPFPFIGRSAEKDLVILAGYLGSLVARAAAASDCQAEALVERALTHL
ncbi:MAG TPA: hypothetical protein VGH31_06100 [Acidimicrobiales bacterium]